MYQKNEPLTTREKLQYSLIGIIVVGGATILVRNAIRKTQANNAERLTYIEGSPETYAKQIKMAFQNDGWWGTNTAALRQTLIRIPTQLQVRQTITAYQRLYNASLMRDMSSELQGSEYNEMLAIIAAKPQTGNGQANTLSVTQYRSWAERLKAAFDKEYGFIPGTDETAIKAVFTEIPTQTAFTQVGVVYRSMYGNDLIRDLQSELEFWEYPNYMQIIYSKPK